MGIEQIDPAAQLQYESLWGKFHAGEYAIGDQIQQGQVMWSVLSSEGRLVYIVTDNGFPFEVAASEVQANA